MTYYISFKKTADHQAGAKAPNDICSLCEQRGWKELKYPNVKKKKSKVFFRLCRGMLVYLFWMRIYFQLKAGDVVFYQHPARYGSKTACRFIQMMQKKQIRFIALVHDLDSLRYQMIYSAPSRTNVYFEDDVLLKQFDVVICHNTAMKQYLVSKGFREDRLVCLQLFDYLVSPSCAPGMQSIFDGVVIAGNLDAKKSGYVYELARLNLGCPVHLYGINYPEEMNTGESQVYHGSLEPDVLPLAIEGARFGVVWDGNSPDTCEGPGGNYLRFNNPHKLSLYMAAGIPVITWKEAAIAAFVEENGLGVTVNSLRELPAMLHAVTDEQYSDMKNNVKNIREKVIVGFYFDNAVSRALTQI